MVVSKTFSLIVAAVFALAPSATLACQSLCTPTDRPAVHCHATRSVAVRVAAGPDQPCSNAAGALAISVLDPAKKIADHGVLATTPPITVVARHGVVVSARLRQLPFERVPLVRVLRI